VTTLAVIFVSPDQFLLAASVPTWGDWKGDDSASFARTFAAKGYFGGEAARSGTPGLLFFN
jgi:hypothetical protein